MSGVYIVREVVREVLAVVAADELPMVDEFDRYDDDTVLRRLRRRNGDDLLGFGVDEITVLATPVVWLALAEMAKQLGSSAAGGTVRGVTRLTSRILRRPTAPTTLPQMSGPQLGQLRSLISEISEQRGLDTDRAQVIADAVVAQLAASDSRQRPPQ
ncbi:hypothetical protein [Nocardia sp. CA-119907]|uniref:hypothetical protein n=1 Tax=Nocardia sp. CA-119907 TaxID=3239973 RepID=UPI003D98E5B6